MRVSEPRPIPADLRFYRHRLHRIVEGQHRISTNRLVDDPSQQAVLEALVEEVKPVLPAAARGLHYLLATPFRYGHARGSRFRRAGERPGIFYASERVRTAVAETAYWRLFFFSRSPGVALPATTTEYTGFSVAVAVDRALDLEAPPMAAGRAAWSHPTDYAPCQTLAGEARGIGAQAIRYVSARDSLRGANVALFDPAGFHDRRPRFDESWHFRFEAGRLVAFAAFPSPEIHNFTFEQFGLAFA